MMGPVKIQIGRNTFELRGAHRNETIRGVRVSDSVGETVWEIRATRDVPARGFLVTVGTVPSGFLQIASPLPQAFAATPGRPYWIEMDVNLTRAAHSIAVEWIAEQAEERK